MVSSPSSGGDIQIQDILNLILEENIILDHLLNLKVVILVEVVVLNLLEVVVILVEVVVLNLLEDLLEVVLNRGGSKQPKFTGFDGKPLDQVDPSTEDLMENLLIPYLLKVVILGRILENLPKVVLENGGIRVEMKELKMKMTHLLDADKRPRCIILIHYLVMMLFRDQDIHFDSGKKKLGTRSFE